MVRLDGALDGVEILLTRRHVLQYNTVFDGGTIGQHTMHGERREEPLADEPLADAAVVEHLRIADVVLIRLRLAVDDNAEHVKNGVTMAVERRALQRIAVGHAVLLPLLVQLLEGQFTVGPERVDDPDVLVEYQSWFHVCKSSK